MTSSEIIEAIDLTGKLMELHGENPFKQKAYSSAAYKLKKLRYDFEGKSQKDIENIEGIGKSISAKILEFLRHGTFQEYQSMLDKTPQGIIDVLEIKGLGPKKVKQLWDELEIETVGELLYACNENRLITLKGFGLKTQQSVIQSIEFLWSNRNKFHYATLEKPIVNFIVYLKNKYPGAQIGLAGQMARHSITIDKIEILTDTEFNETDFEILKSIPLPVEFIRCEKEYFYHQLILHTSSPEHLEKINFNSIEKNNFGSEIEVYHSIQLPFIPAELREGLEEVELAKQNKLPILIELKDLKGVLHNHSKYSDGLNTLKEMADYCLQSGYSYFGICDHSKSAGYAGGLSVEKVLEQQHEIDMLNSKYVNFKILKGIESDILGDGSLDYPEDILKTFDFVVASVHSNLKMNEDKANQRLISAIENPFTSILGHPTGRLLLARPGYPINHKKIIDACASNKVSIELNAHPYRLDIDWRWIPYCLEKGVMISINPDAHHIEGIHDMYYGVIAARKGLLTKEQCLNALNLDELVLRFRK